MPSPGLVPFDELVLRALHDPRAEAELARRYLHDAATLVVDFSGMVARTDARGIVYALALARAAEQAMTPAFAAHRGQVVKRVADTLFVAFDHPGPAVLAALDAQRRLAAFNRDRAGHRPGHAHFHAHAGHGHDDAEAIHASIGLGHGPTLVIPGQDLYGPEVNRAFVLGEDVGRAGEVLASLAFVAALGPLPPGVGAHAAPAARAEEAGFGFVLLRDHRDA